MATRSGSERQHELQPWYRQFWPWFVLALPASAVVASLFTVYIAMREAPVLVVDDYAKIGLATHRKIERDRLAAELGLQAEIFVSESPARFEIELGGVTGPVQPTGLTLSLFHPTLESGDRTIELIPVERRYVGNLETLPDQRMYIRLEPTDQSWRLIGEFEPGDRHISLIPQE
jgi:hypothetical protein